MAISLEGKIYQVDLCEKHYRELKLQLNPYLENATVADQHIAPEVKVVQNEVQLYREKNEKYPAWKIRQWLKQIPGVEVNKHGPIHPDLIKRFEEHFNVKLWGLLFKVTTVSSCW